MQIFTRRRSLSVRATSSLDLARETPKSLSGLILSLVSVLTFSLVLPQGAQAVIRPVRDVQQALASKGFDPGASDGFWGDRSVAALRAFQKQNGLPETGVIDDGCLRLLLPASPTLPAADAAANTQPATVAEPTAIATSLQAAPKPTSPPQQGSGVSIVSAVVFGIGALILLARRGRRKV